VVIVEGRHVVKTENSFSWQSHHMCSSKAKIFNSYCDFAISHTMTELLKVESEPAVAPEGVLGGREVDADGVNSGLIRCPRCSSRILTKTGTLIEKKGDDQLFFLPTRPGGGKDDNDDFTYVKEMHQYWWLCADINLFDNLGLSRPVDTPRGRMKFIICSECGLGPFGYQTEDEPELWVCCSPLIQQDVACANDAEDFRAPAGMTEEQLKAMMASGGASLQYHVVFEEQRLGMCLGDTADGTGVEVFAFTEEEGVPPGPAQSCGKIQMGDRVMRVNGKSTVGLNYEGVLDLIIHAARPITIHWERDGRAPQAAQPRIVPHDPYIGKPRTKENEEIE
jgi:hypothetical protein